MRWAVAQATGRLRWPRDERGAALVVVLLFAALLAGLAGIALQGATSGARAAAVFLDEMRADALGRAAADAIAARVLAGGPGATRGGAFDIRLDQAEMAVVYRSESARVDVNKAPADLIGAVLAAAGADPALIASVQGRIAGDRGTAAAAPVVLSLASLNANTPPPQPAKAAPMLESPRAAFERWGLPDAIAARAAPAFTIANGTATVDPILADRLVLLALLGEDARVDDYIERRGQGFADTRSALALLPVPTQAYAGFVDVSAVAATAEVTIAHRFKRRYAIVLDPPAFAGEGPKVLSFQPLF